MFLCLQGPLVDATRRELYMYTTIVDKLKQLHLCCIKCIICEFLFFRYMKYEKAMMIKIEVDFT